MIIRRAKPKDINQISALRATYGLEAIDRSYINQRDIAFVAEDAHRVVGFLWVGLMRGNKKGYIDCFTVAKEYAHKGVGKQLAFAALAQSLKQGVEYVFGIIAQSEHHDKSAYNALRMAMGSSTHTYTLVQGQISNIITELKGHL